MRVNWRDQVVKASTVTEKFVKIHLVFVQNSRKEDATNFSGISGLHVVILLRTDLARSACGSPIRSLFYVAD